MNQSHKQHGYKVGGAHQNLRSRRQAEEQLAELSNSLRFDGACLPPIVVSIGFIRPLWQTNPHPHRNRKQLSSSSPKHHYHRQKSQKHPRLMFAHCRCKRASAVVPSCASSTNPALAGAVPSISPDATGMATTLSIQSSAKKLAKVRRK